MLKNCEMCDKIKRKRMFVDIMNKNSLSSLAMLDALWQTKHQDLLSAITPFVLYAVGDTTKIGEKIDITQVCAYMDERFGYKLLPISIVSRILSRQTSISLPKSKRTIKRCNKEYILVSSLSELMSDFSSRHTLCKEHTFYVVQALTAYLNQNHCSGRGDFTFLEVEPLFLTFMEKNSSSIVHSVENLRQIVSHGNIPNYYIGKFILQAFEEKTLLQDYLLEISKGVFLASALYLQGENANIVAASFSDTTFFLDTRLLLGYLGFKSEEENKSVRAMVESLKKRGAKFACFIYNIVEVQNILESYMRSLSSSWKSPSALSLEFFDENHCSAFTVYEYLTSVGSAILADGISIVSFDQALSNHHVDKLSSRLLDEAELREKVLQINPRYNLTSFPNDAEALSTISCIRAGKHLPDIENSQAVFVTQNTVLSSAVSQCLGEQARYIGFPLAVTGDELCVIAWLKDPERNASVPTMRLVENALPAVTPSKDLLDAYFNQVNIMENRGEISKDAALFLRIDRLAREKLMDLTHGDKENLTIHTPAKIIDSFAYDRNKEDVNRFKNQICVTIENKIDSKYERLESRCVKIIHAASWGLAIAFVLATVITFSSQWATTAIKWSLPVITFIPAAEAVIPFFSKKDSFLVRALKRKLNLSKLKEINREKKEFLSNIDFPKTP